MHRNKRFINVMAAMLIASSACIPQSALAQGGYNRNSNWFEGTFQQVNNNLADDVITFSNDGNKVSVMQNGFFDVSFRYSGEVENAVSNDESYSFECMLTRDDGCSGYAPCPATIYLTPTPDGLYTLDVVFSGTPDRNLARLEGETRLFKTDDFNIVGEVPAKVGLKVTIAGLLKALAPYDFIPEMRSVALYLKNRTDLDKNEIIKQDERNRFLSYSYGDLDKCLDCKYWNTSDGNVLLVVDCHDSTYQYPQSLKFYLFDRKKGTLRQLPKALSAKWPLEPGSDNDGICYQVRYSSDGIVALVPQAHGDSFDIVTLKFDGKIFK